MRANNFTKILHFLFFNFGRSGLRKNAGRIHLLGYRTMKRIDQWKAKLRAAKSELRHKTRQLNAAQRTHARTTKLIEQLEKKIELHLAKT